MKQLFFSLLLLIVSTGSSFAQTDKLVWYTDAQEAQKMSDATNKPIFAFFTGSDWCGWCHKLQREVFAKEAFIKWAQKEVILLEIDFPRNKQLSPELAQQNNSLKQTFQVTGFPTIWMFFLTKDEAANRFNISGLGNLGYPRGAEPGKEEVKFLADANLLLAKKPAHK